MTPGQTSLQTGLHGRALKVPTFPEATADRGAWLSDDRCYRYVLWCFWGDAPPALFIGLNPSTADEDADDPTIRRCRRFARDWGFGGLLMANLYAWRATKPRDLADVDVPVGEPGAGVPWGRETNRNDTVLRALAQHAGITIAAWGGWPGPITWRAAHVMDLVGQLHVLGLTQTGEPRHPLYIRADTTPKRWTATGAEPRASISHGGLE